MSTIIINEDYDSDFEIFEQRNQQIQQLKEQQLHFKEQLLSHIQNKEYDCNLISPTPYPMDQTIKEKNQNIDKLLQLNKSHDLASDRSQPSSINCFTTKTSKTNLKGNYLFKQSYLPKTPSTKAVNGITTKSNCNKNQKNFNKQKSPSNFSTCEQKSARTPEQPKNYIGILSPSPYNSYLKKDYESKSKQYNLSSFIHKSTQIDKKTQPHQIMKTEENDKSKKLKEKKLENKIPAQKSNKGFDQWYDSQKKWLKQTEEKIFKQKLQMEQEQSEQEQFSYSPEIQDGSRFIVQKKYNNSSLLERQKFYQDELQFKQFQKKLREEEDKKINQIRISPLSRKILMSASPKSNSSFTICNSSNQNYSTIIKK
ncbi:unnamed protein product [Paramecium pentaurelia]|uniref:Uncharacterized protein n=1 Tax=Paramecium pentaurelia TaxID=43138 RepID=A0A8S1X7E2_9CILI|nr:unnamed protein product [Paramecium pentaurelia]